MCIRDRHIITRPVFEALFENYDFAKSNPVSKSMQKMLDLLDDEVKTEEETCKIFSIQNTSEILGHPSSTETPSCRIAAAIMGSAAFLDP